MALQPSTKAVQSALIPRFSPHLLKSAIRLVRQSTTVPKTSNTKAFTAEISDIALIVSLPRYYFSAYEASGRLVWTRFKSRSVLCNNSVGQPGEGLIGWFQPRNLHNENRQRTLFRKWSAVRRSRNGRIYRG